MVQLTSSLVSLLLLACSFELAAAYKAPKISNDTDDDVNLSIVNGKITDYHMFPFISYLFARKDPSSIWGSACTASILNQYMIVTAAHCVVDGDTKMTYPANQITAYVGVSSKDDPNKANRGYPASRVFVHPDYNPDRRGHADVALLQFSKPIQFVDGIKSGCIDYSESIPSYYITAGYGTISVIAKDRNGNVVIPEKEGNELRYAYARETRDAPYCLMEGINNVCLESYYSGQSTCHGDSGGPLMTPDLKICKSEQQITRIIRLSQIRGVDSVGYQGYDPQTGYSTQCNGRESFTRLSRYRNFIDSHVGPKNYCWYS